jgi:hypothetical protein
MYAFLGDMDLGKYYLYSPGTPAGAPHFLGHVACGPLIAGYGNPRIEAGAMPSRNTKTGCSGGYPKEVHMAVYKFDKPLPGEDVLSYLARHNALPGPGARHATEEEMAECDRTEDFIEGGFVMVPEPPRDVIQPRQPVAKKLS